MTIADTFQCKIIDEYGGVYPDAVVAILDGHEYSDRSFSAEAPGSEYVFKAGSINGAAYMVMYWYSEDLVGKFKSRPLRIADGNGFTNIIKADMTHEEAIEIMARPMSADERLLHLIKSDLPRKFI